MTTSFHVLVSTGARVLKRGTLGTLPAFVLPMMFAGCPAFSTDDFRIVSDVGEAAMDGRADDAGPVEGSTSDVVTDRTIEASASTLGDAATDALVDVATDTPVDVVAVPDVAVDAPPDAPNCPAGSCVEPPSCRVSAPGTTNCGASGESCCTSLTVAGGTYYRTYSNSGSGPTGQADQATVSGFRLDKYLVTVGRFRQFVSYLVGGGSAPSNGSGKHTHLNGGQGLANSANAGSYETGWEATGWNTNIPTGSGAAGTWNMNLTSCSPSTWTSTPGTQENLPLNCIDWFEAYAFCIWDGGFLPSEAEWEYAAAGGTQQREYPWGTTDPGTGSLYAIYGNYYPSGSSNYVGLQNIASVGTAAQGVGLWGQLDLAGEVWEWNLDWYASYVNPCTDCAYLSSPSARLLKGGDFYNPTPNLLPPSRVSGPVTDRGSHALGFRCARTP